MERIVGSCSELGFIERDWSLFLVNVYLGVFVYYKYSWLCYFFLKFELFILVVDMCVSGMCCDYWVSRELDRGFIELCNRGLSVYILLVNRLIVGFIDNLCVSDIVSDFIVCFSVIYM